MTADIKEKQYYNHPSFKSSNETKPPLRIDRNCGQNSVKKKYQNSAVE